MLVYKFLLENGTTQTVPIQLIDNQFVDSWRQYLKSVYKNAPKIKWYITRCNYNTQFLTPADIIQYLARLYACFLFFRSKKIDSFENEINKIEYLFKNPSDLNQHDLNVWHRHFTTLEGKFSNDPTRTPPDTLTMDLYQYIADVNQFAHRCEGYTYSNLPRRKKYNNCHFYAVQFTNANNMAIFSDDDNHKVWNASTPLLDPGNFDAYKSNTDYTVWIHEDIVGKDQVKAWLDHDDLSQFDITGNTNMTPNVSFDPYKMYNRIVNDPEFKQESLASGKTLDRNPLGNILNIENIDFDALLSGSVYSIELDGEMLWNYAK